MIEAALTERLQAREQAHLLRTPKIIAKANASYLLCEDKDKISFASSDYLGLANHPFVIEVAKKAMDRYGVGSTASPHVSGYYDCCQQLEQALADFTGFESCLIFSSGYSANLAILSSLLTEGDYAIHDKSNHASLIDATRLSGATLKRYLHLNPASLATQIKKFPSSKKMIITEGVFSTDGALTPLPEICHIAQDTMLMVDDAHGFGVLGEQGRGSLSQHGLTSKDVTILMATFSKAMGSYGAFVASNKTVIESLRQFARPYMYSTSLPASIIAANRAALSILQQSDRQQKLLKNIEFFKGYAADLGLAFVPSESAIQSLVIGDAQKACHLTEQLFELGFLIAVMRPPSVTKNNSLLRISLSANHQEDHIMVLLDILASKIEYNGANV